MAGQKFTTKQGEYLAFIHHHTVLHGCAPTEMDIARHVGVSPPLVHQMVVRLKERGLISHTPHRPRSISVLVPVGDLPALIGEKSRITAPPPVVAFDGRAEIVARAACRMLSKMFELYEVRVMDDSEFAPFILCVADSVDEELRHVGLPAPESVAARKRVLDLAVDTYVGRCAANDPEGADAEEDADRLRRLMAPQRPAGIQTDK